MQSMRNQVGYKVRNLAHYGQPHIEIHLDGREGPRNTWVTSYSTMDAIEGHVAITAPYDMRFEDIDIAFIGTSQVFVDRLTTSPTMTGRTEAMQRFLVLRQPIDECDFPSPRILETGRTYKFPFTFIIPSQLLPKSCPHKVTSDHVRECHLMLPPSLGDPDLAGFGTTLLDDFAPEMSKIMYNIKVRIAHQKGSDGAISIMATKSRKVRVKPAFTEQAPLNIDGNDEYRPKQEKTVKKGLFKGKLGTVSARTVQPRPLWIPGARTTDNKPITTMAKLVLRFDPSDESHEPPRLGSLSTKLKVNTFYASAPRHSFPVRSSLGFDISQGLYSENVSLSALCIGSASWEKHSASENPITQDDLIRRDSGISDCSTLSAAERAIATGILPASKDYKKGTFYTAQVLVPVTLPDNKNFIPTFHSCLISRTYSLGMSFAVHGAGSLSLKVPIQICADGSASGIENARARSVEESVLREAAQGMDMFVPRSVAPPPSFEESGVGGEGRRASVISAEREELPPDYSAFANPTMRYRVTMVA